MAVDEAARHQLVVSLESALGPESTSTLMTMLQSSGADVATKQDVAALGSELRSEISDFRSELHAEVSGLRAEMYRQFNAQTYRLIGAMFTLAGITWAAVTFGG